MQLHAEQIVDLVDAEQRQIGQIRIERQEEDLIFGTFIPGPAFPGFEQLFREFEEAVDLQALHVIDELDAAIAMLGLHLRCPDIMEPIAIQDVQIWSNGGITCRLCGQSAPPTDAKLQSVPSQRSMEAPDRLTRHCSGRGTQPPRR
jgi:hypothetical protein